RLARVVTVIDRQEISSAPVQDVNGLLEYVLNLDIRQRGNHGVQADISMRGGTFDQTLVLLNGINITDPQTGHHTLNLPLPLEAVDRIEVLSGPAARAFGVNAFNGVINIITNSDKEQKAGIVLTVGEHGFLHSNVSATLKHQNLRHFVSASRKQSDGYLQEENLNNTDFKNTSIFYHGKLSGEEYSLDWQGGYTDKGFGANSFYTPAYPNQYEAVKTAFGSVSYKYRSGHFNVNPEFYYRRNQDRFELFRSDAPDWYSNHNHHLTQVWGGHLQSDWQPGFGRLSLGGAYRSEAILSNVLGEALEMPEPVPGEDAEFTHEDQRHTLSANAEYALDWQGLHLAAGAMLMKHSELEGADIYPGVEASYHIASGFRMFASYNEALRLPTFTDLYYQGPTNIGNPDLLPEESATTEVGLKFSGKDQRMQLAAFSRNGKNIIDWVKEDESEKWTPRNLTDVNARGIELSWDYFPAKANQDHFVKNLRVSYNYLDMEKSAQGLISRYVLDYLKHKISLLMQHQVVSKLNASWGITFQDRKGGFVIYEDGAFGEETSYDPFLLMDLRLSWKEKRWKIFAEASNLLDKAYYDHGNVPQPGRWLRFGADYEIVW
ncbi:MAG TPA: TonB-dependent receptor, partial [Bacteroidales bacterium]|nr:TonB-dependent receptor [Bacteroidales bacterium]